MQLHWRVRKDPPQRQRQMSTKQPPSALYNPGPVLRTHGDGVRVHDKAPPHSASTADEQGNICAVLSGTGPSDPYAQRQRQVSLFLSTPLPRTHGDSVHPRALATTRTRSVATAMSSGCSVRECAASACFPTVHTHIVVSDADHESLIHGGVDVQHIL